MKKEDLERVLRPEVLTTPQYRVGTDPPGR
jgi:hypothetical protein